MPFPPGVLDDLARAGANIVIDTVEPNEVNNVVRLWQQSTGTVTIRQASRIPPVNLARFAQALGGRITLEE